MAHTASAREQTPAEFRVVDSSLMKKVFYVFAFLALASLAISLGGKWFGRSIAMAGHTDDRSLLEFVIGGERVAAPANMIRFERARRHGQAERLDLYLRWPELDGYSEAARDDFNHVGGSRRIIFASLEPRSMSRDMSGRFAPIYAAIIEKAGKPGPAGLTFHGFARQSGYVDEMLVVGERPGQEPFVARCLVASSAAGSLAPCQRDVHIGRDLSLSYRFPQELLEKWREVDAAILARASSLLEPGP